MAVKLRGRQYDILKLLATSTVPLDIEAMKDRFQKSERTIRYDVDKLRDLCRSEGIEIKYKTKQGYYIPVEQKSMCTRFLMRDEVECEPDKFFESEDSRIQELFFYFIAKRRVTVAEQIAGDFYVSRSTLMRGISRFNQCFNKRITISSYRKGGYRLSGDEFLIRRTAAGYLSGCLRGSYTPEDWFLLLPEYFKKYMKLHTLTEIADQIKKLNASYNIWISNSAFINLLSYCLIRHVRKWRNKEQNDTAISADNGGYAEELLRTLDGNQQYVSQTELGYMREVLNENRIAVGGREIKESRLKECLYEIDELLKNQNKAIDINGFNEDLYDHLKNSLAFYTEEKRGEENAIVIREVKEHYPYFYELAKKCVMIIERNFEIRFSETEICYVGIYLYKNCSEKVNSRKNVILVCATGKGLAHLLALRLENVFPMINIAGQRSPYQISRLREDKEIDFIISTIPLNMTKIPVVKISRILSTEDIKRIQEFLDYGNLVDEIPLQDRATASFISKADPFSIETERGRVKVDNLAASATVISKLILTLLEYTSKFPEKYRMEQDALLGLIIHMNMAVPRWFQKGETDDTENEDDYLRIAEKHSTVFEIMEKFFSLVENTLKISIPIRERLPFFLYIILKEGMEDEDHNN